MAIFDRTARGIARENRRIAARMERNRNRKNAPKAEYLTRKMLYYRIDAAKRPM